MNTDAEPRGLGKEFGTGVKKPRKYEEQTRWEAIIIVIRVQESCASPTDHSIPCKKKFAT